MNVPAAPSRGRPSGNQTPLPHSQRLGLRRTDGSTRELGVAEQLAEELGGRRLPSPTTLAIRQPRPQANSSFVCARIMVCCMMFGHQPVIMTLL